MRIVAIIQARMTSTRLPGKVLKKVLDKTLLEYQLERVSKSRFIDEIVVATTVNESDNPIVDLCNHLGVSIYRGSEEDVLARYYEAATEYKADVVVRLTSDCPVIDPQIIDRVIELYLNNQSSIDYVSNTLERTFPRGMDTEVFSYEALKMAHTEALLDRDREHVTAYIYTHVKKFKLLNLANYSNLSSYRWTVDTEEDFELMRRLLEAVYPSNNKFTLNDLLKLMEQNKDWLLINAHIEQKKL